MDRTTKYDYIEVVNKFVPEFYREHDYRTFGDEEDVSLTFLGKLLKAAFENDFYLSVDNPCGGTYSRDELAVWFTPNSNTHLTITEFEAKLMAPYGLQVSSFASDADLTSWVKTTLLPDIAVNNPVGFYSILSGVGTGQYSSLDITKSYVQETLGLFYFFNSSSLSGVSEVDSTHDSVNDLSSLVGDNLMSALLLGAPVTEQTAYNTLFEFFWKQRHASSYYKSFIPNMYASSTGAVSSNTYLSGTQLLTAVQTQLNTWIDPKEKDNTFFTDSLSVLINDPYGAKYPTRMRDAGSFQRFLKAISLGLADMNLILEEISDLLDIGECPEQFLEYLANNIGWRFLTGETSKWRDQLANAVMVYKTKGSVVGLDAILKLVFPDGVFSLNDVNEAWECYIPKMIYYLLKSDSFISREDVIFDKPNSVFGSLPSNVKFNHVQDAGYDNAADRNYRFYTDAVLEFMNNQFDVIKLNGSPFKEHPCWTCIPDPKGFYHRNYPNDPSATGGITVSIPPWEKYGFYTETSINDNVIEFIGDVLSGSRDTFGFEVPSGTVASFKSLISEGLNQVFQASGIPVFGNNSKFRFFTSSHELPPNASSVITYGNTENILDFDMWNTKSSHIFSVLAASSLDYTVGRYDTFRNKAALEVYRDVLREFIPLHVTTRIILYQDLEDTHCAVGTLCPLGTPWLNDFNTEYVNSTRGTFYVGASGTGDLGTTYVNGDGRVLPSYASGTNMFFYVSGTIPRNTSRRRNSRYALAKYPLVRNGTSMPVALNHYGIATSAATVPTPYLKTWEYLPKGFEYDIQEYAPMSSTVWDASGSYGGTLCNAPGNSMSSLDTSTSYPIRTVPNTGVDCSGFVMYRDDVSEYMEAIIGKSIRINRTNFSDPMFMDYAFGDSVHRAYHIYRNEFNGVLRNLVSPNIPFYGGYNFISYAFGPTINNSDFRYKGVITDATIQTPYPGPSGTSTYPVGYLPEFSAVVGGDNAGGAKFKNQFGADITLNSRTYFNSISDASSADSQVGIHRDTLFGRRLAKTGEILSGIEIEQYQTSKSFVVVNDDSLSKYNASKSLSISMFNTDGNPLWVCVPFLNMSDAQAQEAEPPEPGQPAPPRPISFSADYYNTLRPQSQFRLELPAKATSYGGNTRENAPQILQVMLVTSGSVDDAGNDVMWGFDWRDNRWSVFDADESTTLDFSRFKKQISVLPNELCPELYSCTFHTQDELTERVTPCGETFASAVHTESTAYRLRISNATPTKEFNGVSLNGISLYEISIVDTVLNRKLNGFNSYEVKAIFNHWDDLTTGAYSRDSSYSDDYFSTSGGSRAEYYEVFPTLGSGAGYTTSGTQLGDKYYYFEVED